MPPVSGKPPSIAYEPNEYYDSLPPTGTSRARRRVNATIRENPLAAPSSSSGTTSRSLRRTPPFEEQQLPRSRSNSIDSASRRAGDWPLGGDSDVPGESTRRRAQSASRDQKTRSVHPALRISKRTASAIRYALEVGLRNPNPFTPDPIEEGASMSDLGRAGRTSNGGARGSSGQAPIATGQGSPALKTPTEIMHNRRMREAAKQAQATQQQVPTQEEDRRRSTTQQPVSSQEEDRRRSGDRRYNITGGAGPSRDSGYRSQGPSVGGRTPAEPTYQTPEMPGSSTMRSGDQAAGGYGTTSAAAAASSPYEISQYQPQPTGGRPSGVGSRPNIPQSSPDRRGAGGQPTTMVSLPAQSQAPVPSAPMQAPTTQAPRGQSTTQQTVPVATGNGTQTRNSNVSSFPHAFERWETLSSRWEGLTSYWLGRLERNTEEVRRDPERQQMSRQITDLSAAGANLFHAVVELQRLRASSERKFQRWFFETRDQQEQSSEAIARLQRQLDQERQDRRQDTRIGQQAANSDRLLNEYRRELQISKDEARRAWEELGRRQRERQEQILALKEGYPIDIGGVQVVPHTMPSRGGSLQRPEGQQIPYASQTTPRGYTAPGVAGQEYPPDPNDTSPTNTDPFSGQPAVRPGPGSMPMTFEGQPAPMPPQQAQPQSAVIGTYDSPSARFYSHGNTFLHGPGFDGSTGPAQAPTRGGASFSSDSDEEPAYELDDNGRVRYDSAGNPIPYRGGVGTSASSQLPTTQPGMSSGAEPDELRQIDPSSQQSASTQQGAQGEPTSAGQQAPQGRSDPAPVDYEGTGWGGTEEDDDDPSSQRHHHPTRLSDIREEGEEGGSRASASRASRASSQIY